MQGYRSAPHPVPFAMPDPYGDVSDDESDAVSVMSVTSNFAPSVATSATTVDWEMRSASPAPSVYSMTSSLRASAYREEYGRGINNYSEVYRLPADDEEFERLGAAFRFFLPDEFSPRGRSSAHHVYGSHGQVSPATSRGSRRRHPRSDQGRS